MDLTFSSNFVNKVVTLYDDQDRPFRTFCRKMGNSVLTLLESYSKNNSFHSKIAHSYFVDSPVNTEVLPSGAPFPFQLFRLSKSQMISVTAKARFLCAQCTTVTADESQNEYHLHDDELLKLENNAATIKALFDTPSLNDRMDNCVTVYFMLALNRPVANKKLPAYSSKSIHFHFSMDESASRCDEANFGQTSNKDEAQRCGVKGYLKASPDTYNLFGSYNKCSQQFSCSRNLDSITSWWMEEKINSAPTK